RRVARGAPLGPRELPAPLGRLVQLGAVTGVTVPARAPRADRHAQRDDEGGPPCRRCPLGASHPNHLLLGAPTAPGTSSRAVPVGRGAPVEPGPPGCPSGSRVCEDPSVEPRSESVGHGPAPGLLVCAWRPPRGWWPLASLGVAPWLRVLA